ncbi:MAG: DUF2914 domain-containing protein [Proteobacteria bacterium]|nr:DUF2914 domain-containing protein [Pseudomonadota bacterium]
MNFLRFQDKTINLLGKSILLTVGMQKKSLEGIPMAAGFLLDVFTLGRIDQLWSIALQVIYIVMIFVFIGMSNIPEERRKFGFFWKYYDFLLQFCFGGLLSAYSIFYFKSASSLLVVLFAAILFFLMVVNESKRFHAMNFPIRHVLASLCLTSFMVYFIPIIFHWMNWFSFLISVAASYFFYMWFVDKTHKGMTWKDQPKKQRAWWGGLVPILFTILYFFKLIPPVPLSCSELGVYHNVERKGDVYELYYTRPAWKFWESGDQTFIYRDGDRVNVFTSVFAPSNLKHKIQIRWEKKDQLGNWQTTDIIPIAINGGRDKGYRGVANKQNVQLGQWRVRIETEDGRELRRLKFKIISDENPNEIREARINRS